MQITSFELSADKTNLEISIVDAASLTILRLWNDQTYKNFTDVIDLSAKLTGSGTESITVSLSDISEPYFDGIYFLEAKDNDETSNAIASELSRFKECIMDKLLEFSICDECLDTKNASLINAHVALRSLQDAIDLRFVNESIKLKKALDKYCSNACRSCGDYSNITTSGSLDTLNPDTIIVKIDGGSLD